MARPKCCRRIAALPYCGLFKPAGVLGRSLAEVVMTLDELEAIRLADHEGLYQEQAAVRLGVSRQTFGRIVELARRKVAQALVEGRALRIEGGAIEMAAMRVFECSDCGHVWELAVGTGRPTECPACQTNNLFRRQEVAAGASAGRGGGRRHRHGGRGRGTACQGRGAGQGRNVTRAVRPHTTEQQERSE